MADLTSHEAAAHEAHALPVMLPPGKLIGRDVVLARVYSQLKENKPVLVYGAAGIGKTALAATLASAYTELPGGVLWLNVNNTPFSEILARIGRAYAVKEVTTSDNPLNLVGLAMNTVIAARPLVVFDGLVNTQAVSEFIMRSSGKLPVLLVNETEISGPWTTVPLGNLETAAATTLFKNILPDQTDGLAELIPALKGIPFAITVAAGAIRARKQTPAAFLAALPKRPEITPPLLALTTSFSALNNALQGLLLLMGATFRGEASPELISLLSGAPEDTVSQALTLLTSQNLVERTQRYGKPYYRLHTITHTFAQTWLRGSGRLEGLQGKVRDAVLAYTRRYSSAPDRLASEMDNFIATAASAADKGDRDIATQLAAALMQAGDFVKARGYVYELLLLRRMAASSTSAFPAYGEQKAPIPFTPQAQALEADEEPEPTPILEAQDDTVDLTDEVEEEEAEPLPIPALDDDEEEPEADEEMAATDEAEETQAEPEVIDEIARMRASLVLARQSGDRRQQAALLNSIGQEQVKRGQETEAIATYTEALNVDEALNDTPGLLATLETLAELENKTDNSQAAVLHATRGVKLAEHIGNDASQRSLLTLLGDARQQIGESEEAIQSFAEALDLARADSDKASEALVLYKLGYAQLDNGQPTDAIQTWEDALTLFREQHRRDYEGKVLAGLGTASGELDRWAEATKFHTSALYIARELKDRDEEMLRLSDLGYASVQAHQLGQAVLRYRQALHLAYESNNRENIVSTTVDLARLLVESQRHLDITELLVDEAEKIDPNDRDLRRLKERIQDERPTVPETLKQATVTGTAQDYAAYAYALLDNP